MELVTLAPSDPRTRVRCRVCGFTEVHTDQVAHRGVVLLAQCVRCDHRWTETLATRAAAAPVRPLRPRLAGAA